MSKPKAEELRKNLRGAICPIITPMKEDCSVDLDAMGFLVDDHINRGIVNGRGGPRTCVAGYPGQRHRYLH